MWRTNRKAVDYIAPKDPLEELAEVTFQPRAQNWR